jgi:hypothetical protein
MRDGEVLFLKARTDALPEVHLDDLVDGISTTMRRRPHGWSAEASRRLPRGASPTRPFRRLRGVEASGGGPRPSAIAPSAARRLRPGVFLTVRR